MQNEKELIRLRRFMPAALVLKRNPPELSPCMWFGLALGRFWGGILDSGFWWDVGCGMGHGMWDVNVIMDVIARCARGAWATRHATRACTRGVVPHRESTAPGPF